MRKILTILLLTSTLLLSSCVLGGGRMIIFDDSDRKSDERMKQIIETFKDNDKEALKDMFSKQALSETEDFEENLDALFDYIQGNITSWKSTGGYGGSEEINADGTGNHKKETQSRYILTTSEQEYQIAVYEYTIDKDNPDNIGLYSFCIISDEDNQDTKHAFWGNREAGINIG